MIAPKALDAALGKILADVAAALQDGDVIAIDCKALRGARDTGESARTRMMVSAYSARLRLTLASATADHGTELDAALEVQNACNAGAGQRLRNATKRCVAAGLPLSFHTAGTGAVIRGDRSFANS